MPLYSKNVKEHLTLEIEAGIVSENVLELEQYETDVTPPMKPLSMAHIMVQLCRGNPHH